jgi:hypothetical protein
VKGNGYAFVLTPLTAGPVEGRIAVSWSDASDWQSSRAEGLVDLGRCPR